MTSSQQPRLDRCMRKAGTMYANGEISRDRIIEVQVRASRLRARKQWMVAQRKRAAKALVRMTRIDEARAVIASGAMICAMDTEFRLEGPVEQLGITRYENGALTTMTFTVDTAADVYVDRPSLYGPDFIVSRAELQSIAQATYAEAGITAFHDYTQDVTKLGIDLSTSRFVDTSRLVQTEHGGKIGLAPLCELYGIPMLGHHNGGNDSRYTLQGLLALVNDPLNMFDNPVEAAIQARDAERRRIMMLPTRHPIPDRAMFDELRQEVQRVLYVFKERERKFTQRAKRKEEKKNQATVTPTLSSEPPAPAPPDSGHTGPEASAS